MYFRTKLPFFELDYTASAKCRYQSHHSMDSQAPKKEHLMKSGVGRLDCVSLPLQSFKNSKPAGADCASGLQAVFSVARLLSPFR
jgi:hypothetical protein